MTTAQIEAGTLTANHEDRIVSGLLLPYGEVGNTNLGKFLVERGSITIPADVTVLAANTDHKRENPVARFMTAVDTDAGVVASFSIGKNPDGDALLAEIASDDPTARKKLSVEVADVVIRSGKAIAGKLFGAAFVQRGAFPSASLLAADVGEAPNSADPTETEEKLVEEITDENGQKHIKTTTRTTKVDGDKTTITEVIVIEEPPTEKPEEEAPVGAATVPNTLAAASTTDPKALSKTQVWDILHAIHSGRADATMLAALEENSGVAESSLFAALNDVKYDGTGGHAQNMTQPQWIGELWDGLAYEQQIVPLFNHADLTSLTINGFRWTTKPAGGTWAGNKANVPTNTPVSAPYSTTAHRFAGGHDIGREHKDFNTPGFFESYYQAMTESYAQWVDETVVLADVLAAATTVEADNPSGLTIGAGLSALIDGAAEVIAAKAIPSFALVAPGLWKAIMKTPDNATLGYLSAALGLRDGQLANFTIRPSSLLTAGNVLVGAREAVTVYELPGVPIRVEAPDMIKGGIDTGVFGYAGTVVHKATALQLVTPYTP